MIDKKRLDEHLNNGEIEYIMCAANWVDDDKEYYFQPYNIPSGIVFCGWRHPCIIQQYRNIYKVGDVKEIQGFLTTKNRFLNRKESLEIVKNNGQLKKPLIGGILTSEDLW
jgi:hypothetical protein